VARRTSPGGAGPKPVAEQMVRFSHRLQVDRERLESAVERTGLKAAGILSSDAAGGPARRPAGGGNGR